MSASIVDEVASKVTMLRRLERLADKLLVEIDDDVRGQFPDAAAVNQALRDLIQQGRETR